MRTSLITKRTCPTTRLHSSGAWGGSLRRSGTSPATRGGGGGGGGAHLRRTVSGVQRRQESFGLVPHEAGSFRHTVPAAWLANARVVPRQGRPRGRQPQEFQVYLHLLQPRHEQKALHGLHPPARAHEFACFVFKGQSFYWHSHEGYNTIVADNDRGRQRLSTAWPFAQPHDLRGTTPAPPAASSTVSLPPRTSQGEHQALWGGPPFSTSPTSTTGCSATNCTTTRARRCA